MRVGRLAVGLLLLLAVAVAYGVADVRQRARLDRGLKHHRTDFTVYQAAAAALRDGQDPYEARSPRGYRYVYPPLLALLLLPVAGANPADAVLGFYALSFLALAAALRLLARAPVRPGGKPLGGRALLVGVLFGLPFLHQSFERGQVTVLLLALQILALVALLRGRPFLAGLGLALAGALRLTPLLPAAAAGVGALAAWPTRGPRPALALGAGLCLGLLAAFVALPVAILGPARAEEVTRRWIERTGALFGTGAQEVVDLAEDQGIDEWRFKNQAPRRVLATWTGWSSGAEFEGERPLLDEGTAKGIDRTAAGLSVLLGLGALVLGIRRLRDPAAPGYAAAFALATLLPIFMTRYAWPTHYVVVVPAAAVAAAVGDRRHRLALGLLGAGTALFYLAHLPPLQAIGAAGCLVLSAAAFAALARTEAA